MISQRDFTGWRPRYWVIALILILIFLPAMFGTGKRLYHDYISAFKTQLYAEKQIEKVHAKPPEKRIIASQPESEKYKLAKLCVLGIVIIGLVRVITNRSQTKSTIQGG
jgi:hypothetical protein